MEASACFVRPGVYFIEKKLAVPESRGRLHRESARVLSFDSLTLATLTKFRLHYNSILLEKWMSKDSAKRFKFL